MKSWTSIGGYVVVCLALVPCDPEMLGQVVLGHRRPMRFGIHLVAPSARRAIADQEWADDRYGQALGYHLAEVGAHLNLQVNGHRVVLGLAGADPDDVGFEIHRGALPAD